MSTTEIDSLIAQTADPDTAQRRFDELVDGKVFREAIETLSASQLGGLLCILGYSAFLSNYIRRNPACITSIGESWSPPQTDPSTVEELRHYKYAELFKLTARDLAGTEPYPAILMDTSHLAGEIIGRFYRLLATEIATRDDLCVMGMGKLGAKELNYSSDIDLIFVCEDPGENAEEITERLIRFIRKFSRQMEEITGDGFLYRVDLKLRPWGRSGPLVLGVEDTENYYAASTEPWERFIWLRARPIAGNLDIGRELLRRLEPFVFRRTLSDEDLRRFLQIKSEMQVYHRKAGNWNVKQGSGGIRDIEFFIQLLQIVNAPDHTDLKTTNTLDVLAVLVKKGFIPEESARQIRDSYLFLRRLENHLQMIDERQTHQLPDDRAGRTVIARSMLDLKTAGDPLSEFEELLSLHRAVARNCFERILPDTTMVE
jgi:glutamate-ammonia-ligase adenylyltransferase